MFFKRVFDYMGGGCAQEWPLAVLGRLYVMLENSCGQLHAGASIQHLGKG